MADKHPNNNFVMNANFETKLMQLLDQNKDEIIKIRRYLHEHPELSFHEKKTSEFIENYYRDLDCQVRHCGDDYGIVVDIIQISWVKN